METLFVTIQSVKIVAIRLKMYISDWFISKENPQNKNIRTFYSPARDLKGQYNI